MELKRKRIDLQLDPEFFKVDRRPKPAPPIDPKVPRTPRYINIFERIDIPAEGGIYRYYKGLRYPIKGFPFNEAINAIDLVKAYTMTLVHSLAQKELKWSILGFAVLRWKNKVKVLQNILDRYVVFADRVFNHVKFTDKLEGTIYLKYKYYSKFSKALWFVVAEFLRQIGIEYNTSERVGEIVATLFEYDDAYRYRVEDLLSNTTKYEFRYHSRRELKRLAEINEERETNKGVAKKFNDGIKILRLALLLPKVKIAFRWCLFSSPFNDLQYDKADEYHVLQYAGYNFLGKTI